MAAVGDRVQVPSKRVGQTPREGVVTGVSGVLLRVTWSSGEESTIFPSMGSVVVVGKVRAAKKTVAKKAVPTGSAKKGAETTRGPAKKAAKSATKKVAKSPAKKSAKSAKSATKKVTKRSAKSATKKVAKKPGKAQRPQAKKSSSKHSGRASKRRK